MAPSATKVEEAEDSAPDLSMFDDLIDQTTFEQILEMDDDSDRDFSKGIVYGFFEQAEGTFVKMESAMQKSNLKELSQLGHFLKGSSATLGLTKIKEACEKIQHYGAGKDESGTVEEPDESVSLDRIKRALVDVKEDYNEIVKLLKQFYGDTK